MCVHTSICNANKFIATHTLALRVYSSILISIPSKNSLLPHAKSTRSLSLCKYYTISFPSAYIHMYEYTYICVCVWICKVARCFGEDHARQRKCAHFSWIIELTWKMAAIQSCGALGQRLLLPRVPKCLTVNWRIAWLVLYTPIHICTCKCCCLWVLLLLFPHLLFIYSSSLSGALLWPRLFIASTLCAAELRFRFNYTFVSVTLCITHIHTSIRIHISTYLHKTVLVRLYKVNDIKKGAKRVSASKKSQWNSAE